MKDFFKDQFFKALEKNTIFSRADVQGNLIFVSDKLCQISGYGKKELIGKKHSIFKHPDVEECYIEELLKKLSYKKSYQVIFKNICRRKNKMSQKKNKMSYFCDKLSFFQP